MSTNALPYIGRKISLVSNSELRYEGILYTINTQESTIALQSVRCFGTEGRKMPEIPPSSEVYDFIIFRGQDIKDLTVLEGQGKPSSTTDPAIISVNQRPAGKDGKGKGDTGGSGGSFMQGKATYGKGASPAPWAPPSPAPWGGKSSPGTSWNTGASWEKGGKGDWNPPAWAPAKPSPPSGKGWNAGYEKGQPTGYGGYGGGYGGNYGGGGGGGYGNDYGKGYGYSQTRSFARDYGKDGKAKGKGKFDRDRDRGAKGVGKFGKDGKGFGKKGRHDGAPVGELVPEENATTKRECASEFDLTAANDRFEKLDNPDAGTEGADLKPLDGYDKTKSFFDCISCEATERAGTSERQKIDREKAREFDRETFGDTRRPPRPQGGKGRRRHG